MTSKQAAENIIRKLNLNGHQALLAGGCVRDMLLGKEAKDYDVATDALPEEIIKLFRRTLPVGAKFGVIIVLLKGCQIEVATFRTESGYADGRHPEHVEYSNAKEDAARRDFTINGMFYNPLEGKLYDYVGGKQDLEAEIVRTIGNADERFGEDYLRMLRAIRFSGQLDFTIEKHTWEAVCRLAPNITKISGERISMEVQSALTHPNRHIAAALLDKSGLCKAIFPGFEGQSCNQGINVLRNLPDKCKYMLALAAFFACVETDFALKKSNVLMLSNAQQKKLRFLLDNRGRLLDDEMPLADLKILLASGYFDALFCLQKAIEMSSANSLESLETIKKRKEALADVDITPKPLLDGNELLELGVKPGPSVGKASREMYYAQLNEELNSRQQAVDWIKQWLSRQ